MSLLIPIAVFVCVASLVGGVALLIRGRSEVAMESRLAQITAKGGGGNSALLNQSVLSQPLDATQGFFADLFARFRNLTLLFEQADTTLTPAKFCAISGGLGLAGTLVSLLAGLHPGMAPGMGLAIAGIPLAWLILRRRKRLRKFAKQLPDALELIARALRAGHSLAAGFHLVADEMTDPIAGEFNRVFEEQNLGIPMDQALLSMTDRVPNLDLKFFVTSLVLQKQTGGDLAEILDKIGELIRERFKIWGQVQALTGEGRLSGIVLLALPPALFLAVYKLNPDYVMVLFSDPMGKQMLAGGVVMQILGALVIRKIVNIKV
jgi:tight adherence protein B